MCGVQGLVNFLVPEMLASWFVTARKPKWELSQSEGGTTILKSIMTVSLTSKPEYFCE